jgi:hypothetical protein
MPSSVLILTKFCVRQPPSQDNVSIFVTFMLVPFLPLNFEQMFSQEGLAKTRKKGRFSLRGRGAWFGYGVVNLLSDEPKVANRVFCQPSTFTMRVQASIEELKRT